MPFFARPHVLQPQSAATPKKCCRPSLDKRKLPSPFFAALRGPSWTKRSCSSSCRSSRPFAPLRGQKEVAVAVFRGPSWPFVEEKKLQLQSPFFAALRGPSRTKGSCSCRSSRLFVALRGQKEAAVAVAVLRGPPWKKRSCRCRSPRPSVVKKRCSSRPLAERPNSNPANLSYDKRQRALVDNYAVSHTTHRTRAPQKKTFDTKE